MVYDFFSPLDEIKRIPSQKAEKNIDECYGYLSNDFAAIARIMRDYNPLELIKLSLWDERKVLKEKKKDQRKNASATLMPVVLQSVLLSSYLTGYGSKRNISIKDWNRLKEVSDDVLRRIIRIVENKTALFMSEGEKSREEGEKYRAVISSYLIPEVVTDESLKKDSTLLLSLLEEKWQTLSFTATDVNTYEINIDNIAHKSLNGIDDLCMRVQTYSDEFALARAKKGESLANKSEDEIYRIITKENGWEGRAEGLARERDGFDLYTLDELTSLESDDFKPFTAFAGSLDMISLLKLGYWPAMRYPFVALEDKIYTFVGKLIPRFIALSSSLSRREAALKDVSAIFFRTGIDTYTYDGNSIDISVLPSYYDSNIFSTPSRMKDVEEKRREELSLKASYGHKRLIVDPDQDEDMINGPSLMISSVFMADAARDRNSKHELIKSLLGDLDFPEKTSEYKVIDEEELVGDVPVLPDDDDDKISDEYEYDNSDGDSDTLNESEVDVLPPEYEKKVVDIKKEEEKYALTDEIIAKEEKESEEEEKYTLDLDDDIFDDSEEEERLDDIGEKEEDEYYIEEENEEQKEEEKTFDDDASKEDESDGQLDFFDLLDEEDEKDSFDESSKEDDDEGDYSLEEETVLEQDPTLPLFDDDTPDEEEKEEKPLDEEIEKEDEEEFTQEEEKAEELDAPSFNLSSEETSLDNEEKEEKPLDDEIEKEDEEEFTDEEEKAEKLDDSSFDLPSEETSLDNEEKEEESLDEEIEKENEEEKAEELNVTSDEGLDNEPQGNIPPQEEVLDDASFNLPSEEEPRDDEIEKESEEENTQEELNVTSDEGLDNEPQGNIPPQEEVLDDASFNLPSEEEPRDDEIEKESEEENTQEELNVTSDEGLDNEPQGNIPPQEETTLFDEEESLDEEERPIGEETEEEELDASSFNLPSEETLVEDEEKPLNEEIEENTAQDEEIVDKEEELDNEPQEILPSQKEPTLFDEEKPLDEEEETVHEELDEQSLENVVPEEETVNSIPSDIPSSQEETKDTLDNDDSFTLPSIDEGEDEVKSDEGAKEEVAPSPESEPKNTQSSWLSAFMGLDETEDESEKEEEAPIIEEDALDIPTPIEEEETKEEEATESSEGENVVEEDIPQPSSEETNPPEEEHQILTMEELGDDDEELPLISDDKDEDIPYSGIIREIYLSLSSSSVFAEFLKDAGVQTAEELEEVIHNSWEKSRNEGKDKLFNIAQYSMSVIISHNLVKDELRKSELYNNAGGVMYAYGSDKWTAILLYIDDSFNLSDAYEKTLTKDSFSPSDWKRVTYIGEQIRNKAMNNG